MRHRRRHLPLALLLAVSCSPVDSSLPYGLDWRSDQEFLFEARDRIVIDGQTVFVERLAEFRLEGSERPSGGAELNLYLQRFYQRVDGRPEGKSEFAISDLGVVSQAAGSPELRLEPAHATPSAPSVTALLTRAVSGCLLTPAGEVEGSPWTPIDPLLDPVDLLDWWLLGVPVQPPSDTAIWNSSREVPRLGRYRLGIQLPLRYERRATPGGGWEVSAAGFAQRQELKLQEGFVGSVELEHRGQAVLGSRGEPREARFELSLVFTTGAGSEIRSHHSVEIRCQSCGGVQLHSPEPRSGP